MEALAGLKALALLDPIAAQFNASLCLPADVQRSAVDFVRALSMWLAMVVAMLLPEARCVPASVADALGFGTGLDNSLSKMRCGAPLCSSSE